VLVDGYDTDCARVHDDVAINGRVSIEHHTVGNHTPLRANEALAPTGHW
jgi:hypothetical protein